MTSRSGVKNSIIRSHDLASTSCASLFEAFRPLLILFIFGQIIKAQLLCLWKLSSWKDTQWHDSKLIFAEAVFFIAGAPIWMSFYSIWLFEASCSGFPVEIYRLKTWCLWGDVWTGSMCHLLHLYQPLVFLKRRRRGCIGVMNGLLINVSNWKVVILLNCCV